VAERIRNAIILADFDLGEALSEDGLAAALGVSRTPVREALRLLQTQGLVTVVPKSGTFVFNPTETEIAELCEYRSVLEVKAATLALQRDPEGTHRELVAAVERMRQAQATDDMRLYGEADLAFHLAFFTHCGNRFLTEGYAMGLGRISALRTHLAFASEAEPARSFADHEDMAAIFAGGDASALPDLLDRHIQRTRQNYIEALQARLRDAAEQPDKREQIRRKLGLAYPL
jgi:DNA-binding GntR family transcriptional regulator